MLVLGVRDLLAALKETLESIPAFADVWIAGEISNLSRAASGHVYFTLKDESAALRCAFFRQYNRGVALDAGAAVLAHGRLNIYEPRGELNAVIDFVSPQGEGVLAAQFERLRQKLEAEGLFAPERKRPLPPFPRRIGVVTSPSGAVLHDIATVVARRWPLAEIVVAPASVQGDAAPAEIVAALQALNDWGGVDVIVVARGGGSRDELAAFDDERVPRAIYASRIPVVSAVGHETDVTLADYAADVRAPTPSVAGELIVPDRAEIGVHLGALAATLSAYMRDQLDRQRLSVDRAVDALDDARPDLDRPRARLDALLDRARAGTRRLVAEQRSAVDMRVVQLSTLSPRAVLERGYALVHDSAGALVASAAAVQAGDALTIRLRDGSIAAAAADGFAAASPTSAQRRQATGNGTARHRLASRQQDAEGVQQAFSDQGMGEE
jgi:exodeoxyribonuclease VII large subunit